MPSFSVCRMQIEIRRMTDVDLPAVEAIQTASLPNSAAGWAAHDFLKLEAWVLLEQGQIVAFLVARKVIDDEFELLNMAVAPQHRRRGFGRALLIEVLDRFPGIWFLEVRASNTAAEALYQDLGFHRSGRRRNYYSSPLEDAIEMTKLS